MGVNFYPSRALRSITFAAAIAVAGVAAAQPGIDSPPPERTIPFPASRSWGLVMTRPWGSTHEGDWRTHQWCAGPMSIPAGQEASLVLQHGAELDLAPMRDFSPNDIQEICLAGRAITDAQALELGALTGVRTLHFYDTSATAAGAAAFAKLRALRTLDLVMTHIGDAGLANLAGLPELESLCVRYGDLTNDGLAVLKTIPKLKKLLLRTNQAVGDEGMPHIKAIATLETVDLPDWMVNDKGLEEIARLPALKELRLYRTNATNRSLELLAKSATLKTLYIGGPQIDDAGLAALKGSKSLERIFLCNSKTTAAGAADFVKAKPGCALYR